MLLSVRLFACCLLSGGPRRLVLSACLLAFYFQADRATPFCPPARLLSPFRRTSLSLSVRLFACFLLSGGPRYPSLSACLLAVSFQADLATPFCPPVCLLSPFRRTSLPLSVRLLACFFQADLAASFCPPVCLLSPFRRTMLPLTVRLLACFLLSGGPRRPFLSACLLACFFQADLAIPFCPPVCLLSPFRRTSLPLSVRLFACLLLSGGPRRLVLSARLLPVRLQLVNHPSSDQLYSSEKAIYFNFLIQFHCNSSTLRCC